MSEWVGECAFACVDGQVSHGHGSIGTCNAFMTLSLCPLKSPPRMKIPVCLFLSHQCTNTFFDCFSKDLRPKRNSHFRAR